jgi:peroxiredoxin
MRGDIEVGARLPDYELPDHDGVLRRLSDLQGSNQLEINEFRDSVGAQCQRRRARFHRAVALTLV